MTVRGIEGFESSRYNNRFRSGRDNYSNLHNHSDADILINTTPVECT